MFCINNIIAGLTNLLPTINMLAMDVDLKTYKHGKMEVFSIFGKP